jgi:hypothetical protein
LRVGDGCHNYLFLCWRVTLVKTGGSKSRALIWCEPFVRNRTNKYGGWAVKNT